MLNSIIIFVLNTFEHDNRVLKEAISLQKTGAYVKVVCLHEEGLRENDLIEGVLVERIRLRTKKWSKQQIIQLIKYVELLTKIVFRYRKGNIYHCNDLNTLPIGVMLKIIGRNKKIVYDMHEHETERTGVSNVQNALLRILERVCIPFANENITVSDEIADDYKKIYSISKPQLIYNCPNFVAPIKSNLIREKYNLPDDTRIFIYQGLIGKGRGIEMLLEVFSDLEKNMILFFIGPISNKKYTRLIEEYVKNKDNILYHSTVSRHLLHEFTCAADVGLCLIEDVSKSYRYAMPNKLFEYIMAKIPVIASDLPALKRIVQENEIGMITSFDRSSIINLIKNIELDKYKINMSNLAVEYCWENQEKKLLKIYEGL